MCGVFTPCTAVYSAASHGPRSSGSSGPSLSALGETGLVPAASGRFG